MKAKPALPERVRSMEGLGVTAGTADLLAANPIVQGYVERSRLLNFYASCGAEPNSKFARSRPFNFVVAAFRCKSKRLTAPGFARSSNEDFVSRWVTGKVADVDGRDQPGYTLAVRRS